MKPFFAILLLLLPLSVKGADPDLWKPLQFLAGTWGGDGQVQGLSGKGTVSFSWELSHQILVYREHTELAAHDSHPASTYEAMMVIYKDPASAQVEASYFGSDDQVTHYRLSTVQPPHPDTVQFLSDAAAGPIFRLTFFLKQPGDLALTYEVKMPGKDTFTLMASAGGHRQ